MNFSIIPLKSGKKAKIYTIQFHDPEKELSEYYDFVYENKDIFPEDIFELDEKLNNMVKHHGIINEFFKRESPESHNIYRILNTEDLRLYSIKYSNVAIIVGNGGVKIPDTQKLIDNPHLQKIVDQLMIIEDLINERIKTKEIIITDDSIEGNLIFNIEE